MLVKNDWRSLQQRRREREKARLASRQKAEIEAVQPPRIDLKVVARVLNKMEQARKASLRGHFSPQISHLAPRRRFYRVTGPTRLV